MFNHHVRFGVFLASLAVFPYAIISASVGICDDDVSGVYSVSLNSRSAIRAKSPSLARSNLSPALIAVKASGGELRWIDDSGRAIIIAPKANVVKLEDCAAVRSVHAVPPSEIPKDPKEVPNEWSAATTLKLSYSESDPPTEDDLANMKVVLVEDYKKGSFMLVNLKSGAVDRGLLDRVERNRKVLFATVVASEKAISPR